MLSESGTADKCRCDGSKYVELESGKFVECACLADQRRRKAFASADLLGEFWAMPWSHAARNNPKISEDVALCQSIDNRLAKGGQIAKRFLAITGGLDYTRDTLASLILRDAIKADATVRRLPLVDLTDMQFETGARHEFDELLHADIFWLNMEIAKDFPKMMQHNGSVLKRMFNLRLGKPLTILTVEKDLGELARDYPKINLFADRQRCHHLPLRE